MPSLDKAEGCLLGLALGDALGAPFEGGVLERAVWWCIGTTPNGERRWTDDTQMSIDVAESLLEKGAIDPDELAIRFARSYRWSRGYGPAAAKTLRRIARGMDWRTANRAVYSTGSFGNGAAMRAPVVGLVYAHRPQELIEAARLTADVTHAHPLGIEGAVLMARATALAIQDTPSEELLRDVASCCCLEPFTVRLGLAAHWIQAGYPARTVEVARELGRGIAAHESAVTSLYLALRFREAPFLDLIRFVTELGGDTDTIGAMAGAVWGAANGAARLPASSLSRLEQRERIALLAAELCRCIPTKAQLAPVD